MTLPSVEAAAASNAAWCDAVCGVHGAPGERFASHWQTRAPAPPLYPNLVTLAAAVAPGQAAVRRLARELPPAGWAVKDSFACLPLADEGFELLFEAEWIARASRDPAPAPPGRWRRVRSEPALAAWEAAWGESAGGPRIFRPALLEQPDIRFLAGVDEAGAIAAGIVAHRAGGGVGISNLFVRRGEPEWRAACLDAAAAAFPGRPLVGYEAGADLAAARALGFASLGPLRVWRRAG